MPKTATISAQLDANDVERFRLACEADGISVAAALRQAVEERIDGRFAEVGWLSRSLARVGEVA